MERSPVGADRIYKIARVSDWEAAQEAGEYRISTLGKSLEDEGFIHTSYAEQVERIGALIYGDVTDDLVVLVIDTAKITSPIKAEGKTEKFPHIYGPLPVSAVVDVLPVRHDGDTFVVDGLAV
jgi:uncharacterized protein (DUF952 family)